MTADTRHATTPATPNWQYALCAQTDPDLFFPTGVGARITIAVKQAKRICGRCPIRSACLAWALDTRQPAGVWGGMDEHERRQALGVVESQIERCWERQEWIEQQLAAGVSQRQVADHLGVSRPTLVRCVARFEKERSAVVSMGVEAA
ncbi:WhiB family transcriptional regulator [Streptomyces olivaceoviridis]|uniref:WhiB family transcriptional regulator n=1 Tax=Streptomyces olivaceoviridis TaxID=1921 RepID=UPI0036A49DB5